MPFYEVEVDVNFTADVTIKAGSEKEAKKIAESLVKDYYRLDVSGAYHKPADVHLSLDACLDEDDMFEDGDEDNRNLVQDTVKVDPDSKMYVPGGFTTMKKKG